MFRKKISRITLDTLSDLCTGDPIVTPVHKIKEEIIKKSVNQTTISLNVDLSELDFSTVNSTPKIIEKTIPINMQITKEPIKKFKWL